MSGVCGGECEGMEGEGGGGGGGGERERERERVSACVCLPVQKWSFLSQPYQELRYKLVFSSKILPGACLKDDLPPVHRGVGHRRYFLFALVRMA